MTSPAQLLQNLEALKVLPKITDEHMAEIEEILDNKPEDFVRLFSRAVESTHSQFYSRPMGGQLWTSMGGCK